MVGSNMHGAGSLGSRTYIFNLFPMQHHHLANGWALYLTVSSQWSMRECRVTPTGSSAPGGNGSVMAAR